MKTIKMFQIAAVTLVLSVLVGCGDQFTSPTSGGESNTQSNTQSEDLLSLNSFYAQIRLKPHRSYVFNLANTGFKKITSIDISNGSPDPETDKIFLDCQDIAVYGDSKDDLSINCHSSGFSASTIAIENLSSKIITLDVALSGVRDSKPIYGIE